MRRCCVPGCQSNRKKPYVSVFQFPKSPGFRNLWLKRVGRPLLKVSENIGVCIKHFEKNCIVDYKDWKGEGGRKRITVKPGAVPSIFDQEENDSFSDDATSNKDFTTNMHDRSSRSYFSDVSKQSDSVSTDSSPKKMQSSTTTDKPFISILKPEDSRTEELASCEEIDDDSSSGEELIKLSPNKSSSPSPYKSFPSVAVCLKDEDRVNAQKELGKGVKRTTSVSSNNSSGSAEVAKLQPKRRKIEKPAPTVLGKQNDCYCWVCHRENVVLSCIACPRAFHLKCAGDNVVVSSDMNDWVCPECKRILTAENVDTRSTVLSEISLDKLCTLLRFSLNKMKHRAGVAFHQPVSLEHYPMYPHYVIHPMDFSLLEKNIKQKLYGCTEAFLADVKWILHNSCVFNGSQHPLSTNAKSLVKTCDNDMQEIEVCPDCFMHSIVRNKYWFSEVCRKPHSLVWAKLKGFPYWPAKVVRIADGFIDARFFGAHDRAWVPISQCYHLSKEMPTSSKPKKKGNYEIALDELNVHVQLLIQKFGKFEYAPYRTSFDQNNKLLAFHGIDVDKIEKEEIPCDTSAVEGTEVLTPSKDSEKGSSSKLIKEQIQDSEKENETHMDMEQPKEKASCDKMKNTSSASAEMKPQKVGISKPVDKSDESAGDLNQLNKIELVLQRIKGYISTVDDDNENVTKDALDSKESPAKKDSVETVNKNDTASKPSEDDSKKKETEQISILSGLIKTKTLPSIEIPTVSIDDDSEKSKAPTLDVVKKNDSFSLKLIETIESCKAKLGLSIESELDKIDSSDSESPDEDDEDEEEEDDDDDEEEQEGEEDLSADGQKHGKEGSSASDDASDESSECDEELNSHSSETDIETIDDTDGPLANGIEAEHKESVPNIQEKETENKLSSGRDKTEEHSDIANAIERTSPEKKVATKVPEQRSANENSSEIIDCDMLKESGESPNSGDREVNTHPNALGKDSSERVQRNELESKIASLSEAPALTDIDNKDLETQTSGEKNETSLECEKMDEDDDIFICPPVKPPTPPLICLDDGTETEPEGDEKSESDFHSKNSSTDNLPKQVSIENAAKLCSVFGIPKVPTSARKSMKRVFKSHSSEEDSSDDDDFRVPPTSHGLPLSGAKRTFHSKDKTNVSGSSVSPASSNATQQPNEMRTKEQAPAADEPNSENNCNGIANIMNKEQLPSVEDGMQNSALESMDVSDEKDAEIFNLKKKLGTLFSAFQLQHWKHNQEKAELRHNMNLIVMEMRASLEADKKQALETLTRTFEREKQRCIEETKKKQWCAYCYQESRYACCWNTSYCTVACQKRHFNEHKAFCTQLKKLNTAEVPENRTKSPSLNDGKENKKVFLLNVVSQADASKSAGSQKESVPKIIASKAPVHLVSSSASTATPTVQLVIAPAKPDLPSGPLQTKLLPKLDNTESAESQNALEKKGNGSLSILKPNISEVNEKKEETSLEEIYFPSPPGISFEGLDTALPDDNIQFTHLKDASDGFSSDTEQMANDKTEDSSAEEDLNWSDVDDTDNELVNIGRGVEVLAKYLNKCLIYGQSAKRLTRCLIDVIFSDIKLLASCSAFGNKSNVTKLTRAALPARKVEAIIDFVLKRFPEATRSEIVLAINMKCKEARNIVGKTGNNGNVKKTLFRRLLAKEQSMEANSASETNPNPPKPPTTVTLVKEPKVNVVCVPSPSVSESASTKRSILPKTVAGPNIMRCNPQILIRPKSGLAAVGPRLLVSPATKQLSSTVRPLISGQKYGGKVLVPVEMKKPTVVSSPESPSQNKQRPYIIIGSPASTLPAAKQNSRPMAMTRK